MSSGGLQHELDTIPFRNVPLNAHNTKTEVKIPSNEIQGRLYFMFISWAGKWKTCLVPWRPSVGFYGIVGLARRHTVWASTALWVWPGDGVGFYGIVDLAGWHTVWASTELWVWTGDTRCGLLWHCGSGRATHGVGFYGIVDLAGRHPVWASTALWVWVKCAHRQQWYLHRWQYLDVGNQECWHIPLAMLAFTITWKVKAQL